MSVLLCALSGIVFALAQPNEIDLNGTMLYALTGLALFFFGIKAAKRRRFVMIGGFLFGFLFSFISAYWLMFFEDYALLTILPVCFAYGFLYSVYALFLHRALQVRSAYGPFLVALVWMLVEFVKSTGFLAFPWGLSIYPFHNLTPFLQVADLVGIWPLGFLIALFNVLVMRAIESLPELRNMRLAKLRSLDAVRLLCFILASAGVFTVYGLLRMASPLPVAGNINMVIVQANEDPWEFADREKRLRTMLEMSAQGVEQFRAAGKKADIIVWSETSIKTSWNYLKSTPGYPEGMPFFPTLAALNTPLMSGIPLIRTGPPRSIHNGTILVSPDGRLVQQYAKMHMVPFAEYIPLWNFPPVKEFFVKVIGLRSTWDMGFGLSLFPVVSGLSSDTFRFYTPICFEDAFAYLNREAVLSGADFMINVSNDAWSRTRSAQIQHFVVAKFRSIEMKRILVRADNAGYTCVVDGFGQTLADLPMFEARVLPVSVPVQKEAFFTLYTRIGDLIIAPAVIALVLFLYRQRKKPFIASAMDTTNGFYSR